MNKFFEVKGINQVAIASTDGKTPAIIQLAVKADGVKSHLMETLKNHTSADLGSTKKAALVTILAMHAAFGSTAKAKRTLRKSLGKPDTMGTVPVSKRLLAVRTAAAIKSFSRCGYNFGKNTLKDEVTFNDNPATWGGCTGEYVDYDTYRGAYKGWACTNRYAVLTLPTDWRTRVMKRRLAVVGGLFTVDAVLLDSPVQNVEAYAAKWLEQGRGTALKVVAGFIALAKAEDGKLYGYHSEVAADNAIQGAARKASLGGLSSVPVGAAFNDFMSAYLANHGDFTMTVSDATAVGACLPGIRSWMQTVGLAGRKEAMASEVLEGYVQVQATEARAALIFAARMNRSAMRKAA